MIFDTAFAQTAATGAVAPPSEMANILLLVLIFGIFYFLMIRPQQKRLKAHNLMLENIRRGDKVITGGGIIGTVIKVEENDVVLVEIAPEIKVKVSRPTISAVLAKTGEVVEQPVEKKNTPRKKAANDTTANDNS